MNYKFCSNCGAQSTANFCGQCGAKFSNSDLSLKSFLTVVFEPVTNWEEKMFRTIKHLIINPGAVVRAFIQGDRRGYFHPVKFVLFWGGLNLLVSNFWKVGLGNVDPNLSPNGQKVMELMANYGSLFFIAVIPLLSFAPFLVFRKQEPNYVNDTVMLCFITGMNLLISIPTLLLEGLLKEFGPVRDIIGAVFPFVFCIYMYHSYFKNSIWRSILTGILTFVFLFGGITIILGGLEKIFDMYSGSF